MFSLNNLLLIVGLILLAIAAVLVTNRIGSYQKEHALAAQAEEYNRLHAEQAKIAREYAERVNRLEQENRKTKRQLESIRHETNEHDSACLLGADWVRAFDSYAISRQPTGEPKTSLQRFAPRSRLR